MTTSPFYNYFLIFWIALAAVTFPFLIYAMTAPFGRHTNTKFGPMVNNTFAWVVMESPTLWLFPLLFLLGGNVKGVVLWVFFALWLLHYVNRSLVYPFRIKDRSKKMPLMIAVSAFCFQLGNCYLVGWYLGELAPVYAPDWLYDPRFITGVLLFLTGMGINLQSDTLLLNLRKPGETGYKIPVGGLFRFVSCPNFFGEILEWTGFAIATWSWPGFAFAFWTIANLVPRAIAHHKWYKSKFADYPKERKAVVPFIV